MNAIWVISKFDVAPALRRHLVRQLTGKTAAEQLPGLIGGAGLKACFADLKVGVTFKEGHYPLLLQFPYFNKQAFPQPQDFVGRLSNFLEQLPLGRAFAVELRNKYWINDRLLDLLRARNIALALIDHPWMTPIEQLVCKRDLVTAGFA